MFCHEEKGLPLSCDHFVGDGEYRWRHSKAERLGGFLVDDQFELGWGLNRQVSRVGPFEDAIDIAGRTLEQFARGRTSAPPRPRAERSLPREAHLAYLPREAYLAQPAKQEFARNGRGSDADSDCGRGRTEQGHLQKSL